MVVGPIRSDVMGHYWVFANGYLVDEGFCDSDLYHNLIYKVRTTTDRVQVLVKTIEGFALYG